MARLGVTELLSNVCKHVAEPQCQLVVAVEGEVLCVRLFDRSHETPRVTTPNHLAESGRDLWLLRELAFDIGYTLTTGGKWVWVHCALKDGSAVRCAAHGCDLGSSSTTRSQGWSPLPRKPEEGE
ncbi:ATP-binding protein [Streptomyces albus]|uniref:ATP-binding protein n=1 Tax=Streptomyces albus TaxID=1888 RepID=UPI001570201F|nr:ATP-binding protein [Streptomyces albus]